MCWRSAAIAFDERFLNACSLFHAGPTAGFSPFTCMALAASWAALAAPLDWYEGREVTKCRNGRQLDGEVAAVSARAQRFTIEWHDGSTEKVSERRLKALLKPPPRVPDLRYLRNGCAD
ncbi:hypothetical protein EMIHUDRAFT_228459 [Emiliania huxleyi CCMP1516]|uniref:Chromo domain-containing protein n=2 Tax=Emiliania huxleyi TaxID=2903 RepID=A0A0D3KFY6_EMIH1|nr:hypothetical protein EMIHUDRAFT_228459 [Emiliania huxleyi CCMP1516]EOD34671.1 hypothetical protein EMIHUDRAFT_228459 [Emiliania huxleyi CCMP1516]|eukprot:XP_005787100.1 hypothetical protein EMIHUDRAFT_228459 [Emiliania huxleyi CCMP1516]